MKSSLPPRRPAFLAACYWPSPCWRRPLAPKIKPRFPFARKRQRSELERARLLDVKSLSRMASTAYSKRFRRMKPKLCATTPTRAADRYNTPGVSFGDGAVARFARTWFIAVSGNENRRQT